MPESGPVKAATKIVGGKGAATESNGTCCTETDRTCAAETGTDAGCAKTCPAHADPATAETAAVKAATAAKPAACRGDIGHEHSNRGDCEQGDYRLA